MNSVFRKILFIMFAGYCSSSQISVFGQTLESKEGSSLDANRLQKASKKHDANNLNRSTVEISIPSSPSPTLQTKSNSDSEALIGININEFNKAASEQLNKNKIEGNSLFEGIYRCLEVQIPDGVTGNLSKLKEIESNPEINRLIYADDSRIFVYCKARFKSEDIKQLFGAHGVKVYGISEHYSLLP
jgi:hypothetical protein